MKRFATLPFTLSAALLVLATVVLAGDDLVIVWSDHFDKAGGDDEAGKLLVHGERVFVVGSCTSAAGDRDFLIRAYWRGNGNLQWSDQVDKDGRFDAALDVAAYGSTVVAVGKCTGASTGKDWLVRAYRAYSGEFLWEDQLDRAGGFDKARAVVMNKNRVFVVGSTTNAAGNRDFVVRAYYRYTGQLLWEDIFDKDDDFDDADAVALRKGRVIAVGEGKNEQGNKDIVVRAYDVKGRLKWSDCFDKDGAYDEAEAVATNNDYAFVVGSGAQPRGNRNWVVRTYDLYTGELIWMDCFDKAGGYDAADDVWAASDRVWVVGSSTNAQGNRDFAVRTYRTDDGELDWEDCFDKAGGFDDANAVKRLGHLLYVVGSATSDQGDSEYVLRIYDQSNGTLRLHDCFDKAGGFDKADTVDAEDNIAYTAGEVTNAWGDLDFAVRVYEEH